MTLSLIKPNFLMNSIRATVLSSLVALFPASLSVASPLPAVSSSAVDISDSFKFGDFIGFIQRGVSDLKPLEPLLINVREGLPFKEQSTDLLFLVNCRLSQGSVNPVSLYASKSGFGEQFVPKYASLGFGKIESNSTKSCSDSKINSSIPQVKGAQSGRWSPFFVLNGHLFLVDTTGHQFKSKDHAFEFEALALDISMPVPSDTSLISNKFQFNAQCGATNKKLSTLKVDNGAVQEVKPGTTFHQLLITPLCSREEAKNMGYGFQLGL